MFKQRSQKITAILLILLHLQTLVWVPQAKADSGILEPEQSSFEPVDAKDMVHLVTGDFTYNIPILNVPGPSGGYPIALSYHSGVPIDMEASWVGLGWNINPGAINRTIYGNPDDYKGEKIGYYTKITNNEESDNSIGLNIGVGPVSFGFTQDWGTYKSSGGSVTLGYGIGSVNIGTEGFSIGTTLSPKNSNLGIGLNYSMSYGGESSSTFSTTVSYSGYAVGYSLSSDGYSLGIGTPIFSHSLFNSSNHGNNYQVATYSNSFILFIPGLNLSFSYNHNEYQPQMLNTSLKSFYGPLYFKDAREIIPNTGGVQSYTKAMDIHSIPYDNNQFYEKEYFENDNNMSFPSYDNYFVTAQGLMGSISPKLFEKGVLLRGGDILSRFSDDMDAKIEYSTINWNGFDNNIDKIHFYFNQLNGSYLRDTPNKFLDNGSSDPIWGIGSDNSGSLVHNIGALSNYNGTNHRHGDGNYIKWFTNQQIRDAVRNGTIASLGVILDENIKTLHNTQTNIEFENMFAKDGIGAFSITKTDGLTYNYTIPVYQFESFNFHQKKDLSIVKHSSDLNKYAYTWLLTSITGPDYYDSDLNNIVSENDYGYHVKLKYGKWTDGYIWRTPYEGTVDGIDEDFEMYSFGRKQIYYLNSIETKTHIAYFVKSLREDDLGSRNNSFTINYPEQPMHVHSTVIQGSCTPGISKVYVDFTESVQVSTQNQNTKKLKLEKIYVLDKTKDIGVNSNSENDIQPSVTGSINIVSWKPIAARFEMLDAFNNIIELGEISLIENDEYCSASPESRYVVSPKNHHATQYISKNFQMYYSDNILDINDIQGIENEINTNALKIIDFNYDYSLAPGVPNNSNASINGNEDKGRLCLKQVNILAKNNEHIMPPYTFEYNTSSNITFNKENKDKWGYYIDNLYLNSHHLDMIDNKDNASIWSLKKVITPIGSEIEIEYESDKYILEAAVPYIKTKITYGDLLQTNYPSNPLYDCKIGIDMDKHGLSFDMLTELMIDHNINELIKVYVQVGDDPNNIVEVPVNIYGISTDGFIVSTNHNFDNNFNYYSGRNSYVIIKNVNDKIGGGLRTKQIKVTDGIDEYKYIYNYTVSANRESGVTSYSPNHLEDRYIPYYSEIPGPQVLYEYVTEENYLNNLYQGKSIYHFDVLKPSPNPDAVNFEMGNHFKVQDIQAKNILKDNGSTSTYYNRTWVRSSVIHNKTSSLGSMLSVRNYNSKNEKVFSKTISYNQSNSIGSTQESFYDVKKFIIWSNSGHTAATNNHFFTSSSKIDYNTNVNQEIENYDLNIVKTTYLNRDFITGIPQTVTTSVNGINTKTITTPAYLKYPEMGSKVHNANNKNMLSQVAMVSNQKDVSTLNGQSDWRYTGIEIQTWNKSWVYPTTTGTEVPVWRKHKTYFYQGEEDSEGFMNYGTANEFIWTATDETTNASRKWVKSGEITKYNHFSVPLESMDMNGIYAATRMDIDDYHLIANITGAQYYEFAAGSFEQQSVQSFSGGLISNHSHTSKKQSGTNGINAHTGEHYAEILPANQGDAWGTYSPGYFTSTSNGLQKGRKYRASVWVNTKSDADAHLVMALSNSTTTIQWKNMNIQNAKVQIGDWKLLTVEVTVPNDNSYYTISSYVWNNKNNDNDISVFNPVYIDDFRFSPVTSSISTYTYNNDGQVSSISDNENFATFYVYDDAGRLKEVWAESAQYGKKKISQSSINYKRFNTNE